jgi:hypothetical protein
MHVQYPMQFKVTNPGGGAGGRATHCGVQEFSSEEGRIYMPHWMMQSLLLEEGAMVVVRNVQLPKARFVKLRPHSVSFLDVSDPRAMLEKKLRYFSALTVGDVILVRYADHDFYFDVLETKPAVRGVQCKAVVTHRRRVMGRCEDAVSPQPRLADFRLFIPPSASLATRPHRADGRVGGGDGHGGRLCGTARLQGADGGGRQGRRRGVVVVVRCSSVVGVGRRCPRQGNGSVAHHVCRR